MDLTCFCVFQDAAVAADKAAELEEFRSAQTVKINPDKPQEHARFLTLEVRGSGWSFSS